MTEDKRHRPGGVGPLLEEREFPIPSENAALQRYELLAQHARDIILFVRLQDGRILDADAAAIQAYGYTREELLQLTIYDLRTLETRDLAGPQMAAASNQGIRFETVHRRKSGETFPVEVDSQGAMLGGSRILISVIRDISERERLASSLRESQERLRSAFANAAIGFAMATPDGRFVEANPAFCRLTGYRLDELLELTIPALIHPDDLADNMTLVQRMLSGEIPDYVIENRYRPKAGGEVWVRKSTSLVRDSQGAPKWITVLVEDVTERKHAEQKLRQHAEDLEMTVASRTAKLHETIAELEQFSYAIVHDMRAPLRAMQGFASMIEEECSRCERDLPREYFRRIKIASSRMDQLIADSLSYSQATRRETPLAPVNLLPLLDGMVETYPNLQPDKADIEIDRHLPVVLGNEAALTQCFGNLLGNAVKFAKTGVKPQIRIWAEVLVRGDAKPVRDDEAPATQGTPALPGPNAMAQDRFVRVWVEDNGIGVPKTWHQRIFDMFQRAGKNHEGTGIGLAIVRKVVERMNGRVGVESEPGQGSRFWVELPGA